MTAPKSPAPSQDPLSWPMRLLTTLVAIVVLAVASVIALVVVAGQIPFYDMHLTVKDVDLSGIGIAWEPNLPTFTPMATEGLVLACTLMAITLVLLNRTSTLWTQAMWFFAGIAAFVNTWHMVSEMGDLFGGILRGGLSIANPFLVHLFVLWCRHLRTGRTLEQARIESVIHWRGAARAVTGVLFVALQHVRHPPIALRAFGYWLGIPGWDYRAAWLAASVGYRIRVQHRMHEAARKISGSAAEVATTAADVAASSAAPVVAEWPAVDEDEIAGLVATMGRPETVTDQRGSTTTGDGHEATTRRPPRVRRGDHEATTDSSAGDHGTSTRRPGRRPQRVRGRDQKVAGARRGGRPRQATTVDISDVLDEARVVAIRLGAELKRERLLKELRQQGHSVGGQRRDALWEAIKAERAVATGE